ncbi:hypothetical protein D3C80_1227120 [compost metagenome]
MVTRLHGKSSVVLYEDRNIWMVEVVDGFQTLLYSYVQKHDAQKRASSEQMRLGITAHIIPFPFHRVVKKGG